MGGVGGVLGTLQESATPLEDGGEVRFIESRQPALLLGGHRTRFPTLALLREGILAQRTQVTHLSLH